MGQFKLAPLRAAIKPFRLHWFPQLRSTNNHAARLRQHDQLYAPAIVLTGRQVAGRGRGSHTWWSGAGSLTVTFALPISEHVQPHQLPLIAGLAAREAFESFCTPDVADSIQLKWPNDLLVHDRKLAGLLCERVRKVDLIGIGANINVHRRDVPRPLRDTIASLNDLVGHAIAMNDVVIALSRRLLARLARPGDHHFPTILQEYDRHHALLGRRVRVEDVSEHRAMTGKCVGIDEIGRLLVREGQATHRVIAGRVRIVGSPR